MTLLVAGVDGKNIWMVADTAITGGELEARDREYAIKIIPSRSGRGLLGFAGDLHHGARVVECAATMPATKDTLEFLHASHLENPSIGFAYGYVDDNGPHLFRVSEGGVTEASTLHIGLPDAFEHFQRIRHDTEIDAVPESVSLFLTGSRASDPVPPALSTSITSMLRMFAERRERDVGGWPVAYHLTTEGAFLCGYAYSVSDPILAQVGPGSIVPHGAAEAGGFGLSVTELGKGGGMVVYWHQLPGGSVYIRTADGYEVMKFEGMPSVFKQRASTAVGQPVELIFYVMRVGCPWRLLPNDLPTWGSI